MNRPALAIFLALSACAPPELEPVFDTHHTVFPLIAFGPIPELDRAVQYWHDQAGVKIAVFQAADEIRDEMGPANWDEMFGQPGTIQAFAAETVVWKKRPGEALGGIGGRRGCAGAIAIGMGEADATIVAHEIGHVFALPHSGGLMDEHEPQWVPLTDEQFDASMSWIERCAPITSGR